MSENTPSVEERTSTLVADFVYASFLNKLLEIRLNEMTFNFNDSINIIVDVLIKRAKSELKVKDLEFSEEQIQSCSKSIGFSVMGGYKCWLIQQLIIKGKLPDVIQGGISTTEEAAGKWIDKANDKLEISESMTLILTKYITKLVKQHLRQEIQTDEIMLDIIAKQMFFGIKLGYQFGSIEEEYSGKDTI